MGTGLSCQGSQTTLLDAWTGYGYGYTYAVPGLGVGMDLEDQEFRTTPPTQETGAHPSLGNQTQNLCFASVASSLKEEKPKI